MLEEIVAKVAKLETTETRKGANINLFKTILTPTIVNIVRDWKLKMLNSTYDALQLLLTTKNQLKFRRIKYSRK